MKSSSTQEQRRERGHRAAFPRTTTGADSTSLLQVIDANPDPVLVTDNEGVVLFDNKAARHLFQRHLPLVQRPIPLPGGPGETTPYLAQSPDGQLLRYERLATPVYWLGSPAWMITLRDTSGVVAIEQQLSRVNRIYAAFGQTARASTRATSERDLFEDVCRIAVAFGGFKLARIARIDASRQEIVDIASAGPAIAYLAELRVRLDPLNPESQGPAARTFRLGVPYVSNDIEGDPLMKPWQVLARRHGLASLAAYPIGIGGQTQSVWVVYAGEKGYFDATLLNLLGQMAAEIGAGLERLASWEARRKTERALAESEALFRQMAAANRHVFWMREVETHQLLYISPAFESVFGRPLSEAPKDHAAWLALLHPDDRPRFEAMLQRGKSDHATVHRYRIVRPDGAVRWVEDEVIPVYKDGRMIRLSGNLTDISEPLAANRQIEFFRDLVSTSSDGFFVLRPDAGWRLVFINPAGARHLGRTIEELRLASVWEWDLTLSPEVCRATWEALRYQQTVRFESRHRRADGTIVPVDVVLNRIVHEGEPFVAGWFQDISRRAQVEAQLREREEKLEQQAMLLDEANDAIVLRSLEGAVLYWNRGAERLLGWSAAEAIGSSVADFYVQEPTRMADYTRTVVAQGTWHGEITYLTRTGDTVVVESRWTLIRDAGGHPKAVLAIGADVTERRRMEASFIRAQRLESIGVLAGGIAHDLNNILSPILLSSDMLRIQLSGTPEIELIETISTSARRGADVIGQILSFSRGLKSGQVAVDLRPLVDDIGRLVQETFPRNIRFESRTTRGIDHVRADPTQMHQVLLNLCVNARDAMPDGGVLTIEVANHQPTGTADAAEGMPMVRVRVSDTGTGIPESIRDRIFEPFFTTKPDGKGTGLGLSTVSAIVQKHGGNLLVESTPGRGSTFTILLPATRSGLNNPAADAIRQLPVGHGELILVIDDEKSVCSMTRHSLESSGYRVVTASDGAEGVAKFMQHRREVAAVLTDMMMPVMDGTLVVHTLRKIVPDIPIISMSGVASAADRSQMTTPRGEPLHFMIKPFTMETLLTTIRQVLDEKEPARAPAPPV